MIPLALSAAMTAAWVLLASTMAVTSKDGTRIAFDRTGRIYLNNLAANPAIHRAPGERRRGADRRGHRRAVTGAEKLQPSLAAYNAKYGWDLFATDDGVSDGGSAKFVPQREHLPVES